MSLLVATPCYGHKCHSEFAASVVRLAEVLTGENFPWSWYRHENDSLITRARDVCAATFLKDTDYQRLLFIDSDISFTPEDVGRLWAMGEPFVAGCYTMKVPDAPYAAWRDGELLTLDKLPNEPFCVDYAGTGFMMIDRYVFEKLIVDSPDVVEYEEGKIGKCWNFFQDPVIDGFHCSEDYFFCRMWREIGGEVWMHPKVRLKHIGTHVFGDESDGAHESLERPALAATG